MKRINKLYIIPMVAAILFCSCSKDSSEPATTGGNSGAIVFGAGVETRGEAITGTTIPDGHSFGVFTWHLPSPDGGTTPGSVAGGTVPAYMPANTKVTKSSTGCSYSPLKYWPEAKNDRLKFFAYYPYVASSGVANIGFEASTDASDPYIKLTYTADNDPAKHKDLMYAVTGDLYHVSVQARLHHSLTKLVFSAQLAPSSEQGVLVKIKSIKIKDVVKTGELMVRSVPASWTPSVLAADKGDYELTIANGRLNDIYLDTKDGATDKHKSLLPTDGELMLIPQDNSAVSLEVKLEVDKGGVISEETNYFVLNGTTAWTMADQIHYKMTVARDAIYITAIPEVWHDGGTVEIPFD